MSLGMNKLVKGKSREGKDWAGVKQGCRWVCTDLVT